MMNWNGKRLGCGWGILLPLAAIIVLGGCTRTRYRRQADQEAGYLVREKSVGTPWELPQDFTIQPDPRSRFFDPTDPDYPTLPPAGPQLYQYQLPDFARRRGDWQPESLPAIAPDSPSEPSQQIDSESLPIPPAVPGASSPLRPPMDFPLPPSQSTAGNISATLAPGGAQLVAYQQPLNPQAKPRTSRPDPFMEFIDSISRAQTKIKGLEIPAVEPEYWDNIPRNCLALMLDFETARREYRDTYGDDPGAELRDQSPRVTLDQLFELARINSREYQRQKEILYTAALEVSLARYSYATKFTNRGQTVDTTYTHNRNSGVTVNSLSVPSAFAGDKALATGGTLVGQFANDVLLTFNGPSGFAADVSSALLFNITQSVFQRDIQLDPLIQVERNLVYQARDFMRFRKEFFLDVASAYYNLLGNYRSIEIAAQNYFAQVRTLQQALEEVESGVSSAPNVIFLNQYERSTLDALARLIRACNSLETALDSLKITIGIPTETIINVDLGELELLTLRDSIEVNRAQADRWLTRLETLRAQATELNHGDILTADYSLTERLIEWLWERRLIATNTVDPREAFKERGLFLLDAARLDLINDRKSLQEIQTADPPKQRILVFQRQVEVIESELRMIDRQLDYADALRIDDPELEQYRERKDAVNGKFETLLTNLEDALRTNPDDQVIIGLIDDATRVLAESETLAEDLDELIFGITINEVPLEQTLERTDRLIEFTRQAFGQAEGGLPPIDISVDEAMVTALVQRLDLMNQRGSLADDWRAIKIAADELKSHLTLSASQTVRTDTNRPFSFSTDNANTRLGLALDLPLNRKRERNLYRRSLINYNVSLRNLQLFEDNIKRSIRAEMRNLAQARDQYPISVLQAALAEEQVISTKLQLVLGIPGVRAPDLIDAYDETTAALGAMVDLRIGYILERARFALELEALLLDDRGFWPEINDPKYQPEPNGAYPWSAGSAYGDFPSYLKVSHEFRRMLNYPPPGANSQSMQPQGPGTNEPLGEENPTEPDAAGRVPDTEVGPAPKVPQ